LAQRSLPASRTASVSERDGAVVGTVGRLVDEAFQGRYIGAGLLRDAVLRTVQPAEIAGIRTILVDTISEAARRFYVGYGFVASPVDHVTKRGRIRK
jgi:hypothetical protein